MSQTKINVVLDIETLGLAENAAIIQIGACIPEFNRGYIPPGVAHEIELTAKYEDCLHWVMEGPLSMDDSTMHWWEKQPTKQIVFSGQLSYVDMLSGFRDWMTALSKNGAEVAVWGNGSDFDSRLLTYSLDAFGMHDVWSFRNNRCFRTLKALFPPPKYITDPAEVYIGEINHTGLGDARYEARLMDWIFLYNNLYDGRL